MSIYRLYKPDFYTCLIFIFPFITFYANHKYNEEILNDIIDIAFVYKLIFQQIVQNCCNYILFGIAKLKAITPFSLNNGYELTP